MRIPAYRLGVAAKELNVSEHHLRRLCEAGLVAAERSEGGHWLITIDEINRLKRDGVPEIPTAVAAGVPMLARRERGRDPEIGPSVPLRRSKRVLDAQDEVEVLRQLLEQRKVELELAELEERLSQRVLAAQAARTAEDAKKTVEAAQQRKDTRQEQFVDEWVKFGLGLLPANRSPGLVSDVQDALEEVLYNLDCDRSPSVVRERVKDVVDLLVAPMQRQSMIEHHIQKASEKLSMFARSYLKPTIWEVRARARAAEAVSKLRPDAPIAEVITVTQQAGDEVQAEWEADRRKGWS